MSADNQYVILQEPDGSYSVRMVFMSELDSFDHYQEYYEQFPERAEQDGWDYETLEDFVREKPIYFLSQDLNEVYRWAQEQCRTLEGYAEYGVAIWCPHKIEVISGEEK